MTESSEAVQVGDTIRFSAEMLDEMTKPDYPLVRVEEIRLAADGSKVLMVQYAEERNTPPRLRPAD